MNNSTIRFLFVCKTVCLFLIFPVTAQSLAVNTGNAWDGIFAGKVSHHEITISGEQNSYALLTWQLILKGRTLSRGRQDLRFHNRETITTVLPLQAPSLKPGVNLEAELIVELAKDHQPDHKIHYESKLKIYGPDVLLSDQDFYRQLNIRLFDPKGTTAKIFDTLKIPYAAISKEQLTSTGDKGLLVIGNGIAFEQQQGLMNVLLERAGAGQQILVLQPVSGAFPVSWFSSDRKYPPSIMAFADDSIVQSFAKGLRWISDASIKTHGLSLQSHRQAVVAKIVDKVKGGWDWVDINYGQSGGRFIVCMLPFDRHIHQSPVPRLILGRLLVYASGQSGSMTSKKKRK